MAVTAYLAIIIIIINFIIPVVRRSLCTGLIYVLNNTLGLRGSLTLADFTIMTKAI